MGVGFVPESDTTKLRPTVIRISNCFDGKEETLDVQDEFAVHYDMVSDQSETWSWAGYPFTTKERTFLRRRARRISGRTNGWPARLRAITELIRRMSNRLNDQWVGKSLLAAVIPKNAVGTRPVVFVGPKQSGPFKASINFTYCESVPGPGLFYTREEPFIALIYGAPLSFRAPRQEIFVAPSWMQPLGGTSPWGIPREFLKNACEFLSIPEGDEQGVFHGPHLVCPEMGKISRYTATQLGAS